MKERPLTPCSLRGERMKSSVSCGRPKLPSSRVKLLKCGIYWMQDFGYCVPSRRSHVHTGPQKTFLKNHTITPSQAASHTLVEALRDERDWQKIDAVAVTVDEFKGIEAIFITSHFSAPFFNKMKNETVWKGVSLKFFYSSKKKNGKLLATLIIFSFFSLKWNYGKLGDRYAIFLFFHFLNKMEKMKKWWE